MRRRLRAPRAKSLYLNKHQVVITEILAHGAIHTNKEGYLKLVNFYLRCQQHSDQEVLIDFKYVTWIDANFSALLQAMILQLQLEQNLVFFIEQKQIETKFDILIRNGLVRGLEFLPQARNSSIIHLNGFSSEDDTAYLDYIEELVNHRSLLMSNDDRFSLIDAFLEIFVNVQSHAQTAAPFFACGQYFHRDKKLKFTLVDTGVGYFPPIHAFTQGRITSASEAILWALEGNTTKSGTPGGLGLPSIAKFCKSSHSQFGIITSGAYWTNAQVVPTEVTEFCGTIVNVIFECTK
jgi:hypothetical protein